MSTQSAVKFTDFPDEDVGPVFVKSRRSFSVDGIARSIRNFATLSEALRMLGAAVLVASMSVFLLKSWDSGNDVRQYLLLLSQTGLLAVAGFAMSHGLRETRGARVFFGLALISICANFVILGAMVFSVLHWDIGLTEYPSYALWQIDSLAGTSVTFAGALVVLVPVTLFCFAIFARQSAKLLSLHFLALNSLLLLPIRGSMAAGTIAIAGILYALFAISKLTAKDRSLKTGEGKFALATLFIPLGIILFRSMFFYQVDNIIIGMVALALFLAARQVSLFPDRSPGIAAFLETLSVPVAMIASLAFANALQPIVTSSLTGPTFATLFTLLSMDLLRRTDSAVLGKVITLTVSVVVAFGFCFAVLGYPSALTAILCVIAGAIMLLMGASISSNVATLSGVLTIAVGLLFGIDEMWELARNSNWVELALFGTFTIVLGSVIERHGVVIKLRLVKWFDALDEQRARMTVADPGPGEVDNVGRG